VRAALRNIGVQPLLDAVVDYLPSPLDVGAVEGHDPERPTRRIDIAPDPAAPVCALAFKILTDAHGDLTFVRLYAGTLEQGQGLYNPRLGKHERAMRLVRLHANEREPVERATAGDIVALVGLKVTATGDTLCDKARQVTLEPIRFPVPVLSMAIEPRTNADRDRLSEALARLAREDPTFLTTQHEETGQTIIAGMGELHLEVLKNRLTREFGIQANVGAPRVSYRQTVAGTAEVTQRFERLIGGRPQQAVVRLRVEALAAGSGLLVESAAPPTARGALPPRPWRALASPPRAAGFLMVDLRATVLGGAPTRPRAARRPSRRPRGGLQAASEKAGRSARARHAHRGDHPQRAWAP
jgi:elongation factor G